MAKNILILNGAARKNGNTAKLVQAFSDGAKSVGHKVSEFYLDGMNIHSCKGCLRAGLDSKSPVPKRTIWSRFILYLRTVMWWFLPHRSISGRSPAH